jgi:hypothetical protein
MENIREDAVAKRSGLMTNRMSDWYDIFSPQNKQEHIPLEILDSCGGMVDYYSICAFFIAIITLV